MVRVSFKIDAKVDCSIRINTCVTEQKDMNNVPQMMYTPNKDDFIQEVNLKSGLE